MPSRVAVGPFVFTVTEDDERVDDGFRGHCDLQWTRIVVRRGLSEQRKPATFLHEVLHAIADATGTNANADAEKFTEEEWVARLMPGLLLFLRDNPAAVRYLTYLP